MFGKLWSQFRAMSTLKQAVVLVAVGAALWFAWRNGLGEIVSELSEDFVETGPQSAGTLTCTMYYTDSCPHCVAAKPEWAKLAAELNGKVLNGKRVSIVSVNCEKFPEVAQQQNIKGFPTFRFDCGGKISEYSGERTVAAMRAYIQRIAFANFQ